MSNSDLLMQEMVDQCRRLVGQLTDDRNSHLPIPLRHEHLSWMCDQLEQNLEFWPDSKLHRWIGFIQGALLANGVVDLEGLKSMFDHAKIAYGTLGEDLFDHLNPDSTFELDIGGQG